MVGPAASRFAVQRGRARPAALVALALAVSACSSEAPAQAAQRECRAHYDILMRWIAGHGRLPDGESEMAQAAGLHDRDPWGKPYEVEIVAGHPHVWSAGPDGKWQSGDEIVYPPVEPGED